MYKKAPYIAIFLLLISAPLFSQSGSREKFVQVTGIVVDYNYTPLGGVTVISQKLRRAAITEAVNGIYSLTSVPGDTILFRAVGYKRYHSIIPEDYKEKTCNIDIMLQVDTVTIEDVTILPWRTYDEFISDMTKAKDYDPVDDFYAENIESIYISIAKASSLNISGHSAYRTAMQQNFDNMRYKGQLPVNNLLNPFAWAKFIKSIKDGSIFQSEPNNKPQPAKVIDNAERQRVAKKNQREKRKKE